MSGFVAFARKELLEQVRTFRLPILLVFFVLIGLGSPVIAKVTPELVRQFASTEELGGGLELLIVRDPDATDALAQYLKNFGLMPLLVILLNFLAVAGEKARGTAAMSLVKPVSRRAFLLAKAAVSALGILLGIVLSGAGFLLYTRILFGEIELAGFLLLNGALALVLLTYLALALFGSVLTSSATAAAGLGIGGFAVIALLGALPGVGRFTPAGLNGAISSLVAGNEAAHLASSAGATAALAVALLLAGERIFARQEL